MSRYFFHLHDDLDTIDEEGAELADADAARAFAVQNARSAAAASVLSGCLDLEHWIEVADEEGRTVLTVPFAEAVQVRGTPDPAGLSSA